MRRYLLRTSLNNALHRHKFHPAVNFQTTRLVHASSSPENTFNGVDPAASKQNQSDQDQFSEMMADRTNALLQSLGIDVQKLKERSEARQGKSSGSGASSLSSAAPLVAAVNVKVPPVRPPDQRAYFFDTQDVYAELRSAGLTPGQAEAIMRTIQTLIHELVQTCKDRSVPTSAAANEAYLFDAASSEVRNEISNSRQMQSTTYRAGLARLQRDVEILEHEATEMTSLLKSDLDIEVHERKNATRAEENIIQLKIQELNNKISTRLNSELKSEIENLRWQITRRSLAAIGVIAALFIWLTQSNSRTKSAKTQERQRQSAGVTVPVPVLAPSMSSSEEPYDPGMSQVEELGRYEFDQSNTDSAKPQSGDSTPDSGSASTPAGGDGSTSGSASGGPSGDDSDESA